MKMLKEFIDVQTQIDRIASATGFSTEKFLDGFKTFGNFSFFENERLKFSEEFQLKEVASTAKGVLKSLPTITQKSKLPTEKNTSFFNNDDSHKKAVLKDDSVKSSVSLENTCQKTVSIIAKSAIPEIVKSVQFSSVVNTAISPTVKISEASRQVSNISNLHSANTYVYNKSLQEVVYVPPMQSRQDTRADVYVHIETEKGIVADSKIEENSVIRWY